MSSSAEDPRYRTKVYLDTYLTAANLTDDAGFDQVKFIVFFADPDYPVARMFIDKFVELAFAVGEPETKAIIDSDGLILGYEENVPVTIYTMDKEGITAEKLKWKAERELRRIVETYPAGSYRRLQRRAGNDQKIESVTLRSTRWIMLYRRDTT